MPANPHEFFRLAYQASSRFEVDRAYWRKTFSLLNMPFEPMGHQASCELPALIATSRISATLAARLDAIGRVNGGSLTNVVMAASVLALCQLSGGKNTPVNVPMTNRIGRVARRTPGMCATLLPLQVSIVAGTSYGDLIGVVTKAMWELTLHQQFSVENLCQDPEMNFDASRYGRMMMVNIMLFNASLQFGTCRGVLENIELGMIESVSICAGEADKDGGFRLAVLLNPAIYAETTAHNLHNCLVRFLNTIAADPAQRIGNIALSS